MLLPKKMKYRKWQKRHAKDNRVATQKTDVSFGTFGLKAITGSWVTARQIEAARRAMTRAIKRGGKIWIRIFPDNPVTNHGAEAPMGKGKGGVDYYMTPVRAGTVMFEMDGVTEEVAREAFRLAAYKLPVKTKIITRV
ncbi:50S ribosomal protein L16 [Patescibacteria group bacterium]|jgi:large subunit ribosomal protein L16|nr:50S ribosomal protein L16 [Patescibacteria group bacterium]